MEKVTLSAEVIPLQFNFIHKLFPSLEMTVNVDWTLHFEVQGAI